MEKMKQLIKNIVCSVRGHNFDGVWQVISDQAYKVHCSRCGRNYAYHKNIGVFLLWDDEVEKFYTEVFGYNAIREVE